MLWGYLPEDNRNAVWLLFLPLAAYYARHDLKAFEEINREEFEKSKAHIFSGSMEIASNIISSIETESLPQAIISQCENLLEGTGKIAFFTIDRKAGPNSIRSHVNKGFKAGTIELFSFPLDKSTSVIGRAITLNEIQVIDDEASRYWCNKAFIESCGLNQFVVIPFVFGDNRIGALLIENQEDLPKEHLRQSLSPLKEQIPIALENRRLYKRVEEISIHDELTGLYNYRFFTNRIAEEISRCRRYKHKMTITMLDIDHFKKFNDEFGHQVGDEALRVAANTIGANARGACTVARYGGEEFVIIEPEATKEDVLVGIERIMEVIENQKVLDENGSPTRPLTISAGIATFPDDGDTAEKIIRQADHALLYSKQTGRNQATLAPAPAKEKEVIS